MKFITRAVVFAGAFFVTSFAQAECQKVYGYVEKVTLKPENLTIPAKLDTGAKTASINASNLKQYTHNGETWIQFDVMTKDGKTTFKRKLQKFVKIKSRKEELDLNGDDDDNTADKTKTYVKRPEVLMRIAIDGQEKVIMMDLADRGNFNYPLLLGRDAIKLLGACINPADAYTVVDKPTVKNETQR